MIVVVVVFVAVVVVVVAVVVVLVVAGDARVAAPTCECAPVALESAADVAAAHAFVFAGVLHQAAEDED